MFKRFFIDLAKTAAAAAISQFLNGLGVRGTNNLAQLFGLAFGPGHCRHFSELDASEKEMLLRRAPILLTEHTDWIGPLSHIPRTWTCYVMPGDQPPEILAGYSKVEDIPAPGSCVVTRGYIAFTSLAKIHFRVGFRWDRSDRYLEFPSIAVKKLN